MDEIVLAALKKWPQVPHCFDWLALDARGDWYMRDEATQAHGPFPTSKGSKIDHPALKAFIERNYQSDERGAWYFQNGPQRVYVTLEVAPWIWRLESISDKSDRRVMSHTGRLAHLQTAWQDADGRLFFQSDIGLGLVHTQDMGIAADWIINGDWHPQFCEFEALVKQAGYFLHPQLPVYTRRT
jgi:hypothetical protein